MTIIEQAAKAAYEAMLATMPHEQKVAMIPYPGWARDWRHQPQRLKDDWIAAVEAALTVYRAEAKQLKNETFARVQEQLEFLMYDEFAKVEHAQTLADPGDEQPEEDVHPIVVGGEG